MSEPALTQEDDGLVYQTGFGNEFQSECLPGALPIGRNNPRQVPFGLYAEQLSGTAFTAPRVENRRTWLYRIQPSVVSGPAESLDQCLGGVHPSQCRTEVNPLRWKPVPTKTGVDFIAGMRLMCTAGDAATRHGLSIYLYTTDASMDGAFYNSDGDFLIVPQEGRMEMVTEMGRMHVGPKEIGVIPRSIVFSVQLLDESARGYVLEVYNGGFRLPELGPIGSNGLANARDFLYPTAWCVDEADYRQPTRVISKMDSHLYARTVPHSPFNVVAWHGNYLPFKYSLERFCAVNSVTYDHLDPSIYTVLTCPSDHAGTALADFVIFPPRFMATDSNTLRPPWFHRNCMSEYMGLIYGQYDAKQGFVPGGASLHNSSTPHGPDQVTYDKAVEDKCAAPVYFDKGLAFMFESCLPMKVAPEALENADWRDVEYAECWQGLEDRFTGWAMLKKEKE